MIELGMMSLLQTATTNSQGLNELLQLPLATLVALIAVGAAVVAIAVRVISNTFHGNRPPVDEGIPFVGGLIKFSKVCILLKRTLQRYGARRTVLLDQDVLYIRRLLYIAGALGADA